MKRWTPILGYLFGILVGGYLVASVAFMGMLGHSWDPLLYALPLSPFGILLSEETFFVFLGIQVLVFWGGMGVLSTLGRNSKARWTFAALLIVHWLVAFGMSQSGYSSYQIGSLGWANYLPYLAFTACLMGALLLTWKGGSAKDSVPPAEVSYPSAGEVAARARRQRRVVALALVALAGGGSVGGYFLYRHLVPYRVYSLDLATGDLRPFRAAGANFLCGVDETARTFTVFKTSVGNTTLKKVSYDDKVKETVNTGAPIIVSNGVSHTGHSYSAVSGRFANHGFGGVAVFTPGRPVESIPVPNGEVVGVSWRSRDSLVALTVANRLNQMDYAKFPNCYRDGAICVVDTAGKTSRVVLDGVNCSVLGNAPSPDGTLFAFTQVKDELIVLEVLNLDTGERRVVTSKPAGTQIWEVEWSPDGQRLAWAFTSFSVMASPGLPTQQEPPGIEWTELAVLSPRRLSSIYMPTPGEKIMTFCSADRLAFLDLATESVSVVDLQTGEKRSYRTDTSVRPQALFSMDNSRKLLLAG